MKSPDGRREVVQHGYTEIGMGGPHFGRIELRGSGFGLVEGEFAEPLAFSADSRFLAAAEWAASTPEPAGRVVVFDFQRVVPMIVFAFTGFVRSLAWEADGSLSVTTWSRLGGEDTRRVWSAPPAQSPGQSWWKRFFR